MCSEPNKAVAEKNLRAFKKGYATTIAPILAAAGFEPAGGSHRKAVDVGYLTTIVARPWQDTVDVALGFVDEWAVSGSQVGNLDYQRFPLPGSASELKEALSKLEGVVRETWLPAIARFEALRRPDLTMIDRALEFLCQRTAKIYDLPMPTVHGVTKKPAAATYAVDVSVGPKRGSVTLVLSAPRSLIDGIFAGVGEVSKTWENPGRDLLVALRPAASALVVALAATEPMEAAKLFVLVYAPFFGTPILADGHVLSGLFPTSSKHLAFAKRDPFSASWLRDLLPLATDGTVLERLEVLRLIEQGFPDTLQSAKCRSLLPPLDALAQALMNDSDAALADEGRFMMGHLLLVRERQPIGQGVE